MLLTHIKQEKREIKKKKLSSADVREFAVVSSKFISHAGLSKIINFSSLSYC